MASPDPVVHVRITAGAYLADHFRGEVTQVLGEGLVSLHLQVGHLVEVRRPVELQPDRNSHAGGGGQVGQAAHESGPRIATPARQRDPHFRLLRSGWTLRIPRASPSSIAERFRADSMGDATTKDRPRMGLNDG